MDENPCSHAAALIRIMNINSISFYNIWNSVSTLIVILENNNTEEILLPKHRMKIYRFYFKIDYVFLPHSLHQFLEPERLSLHLHTLSYFKCLSQIGHLPQWMVWVKFYQAYRDFYFSNGGWHSRSLAINYYIK